MTLQEQIRNLFAAFGAVVLVDFKRQIMIKVECVKSDPLESVKVGEVYDAERSFFRWRVLLNDDGEWMSIPDDKFFEYFKIVET